MNRLMKRLRKVTALKIIKNILEDNINAVRLGMGQLVFNIGSTHREFSVQESLAYIDAVYDDYLKYGDIKKCDLAGKKVLEIGPGDNLGVALRFIADGAAKVVCVDRIYSSRNERQQYAIYAALRKSLDPGAREKFDSAVTLDGGKARFNAGRIKSISGTDIAQAENALGDEAFDLIISRAALEHIHNIDAAFSVTNKHLKVGGVCLHKVDLRDHEMFSRDGYNPFTFLTIPEYLWNMMTRHSGKPNRRRSDYYRMKLSELGYDHAVRITHLVTRADEIIPHKERITEGIDYDDKDLGLLNAARPALSKEFSGLSDEDLLAGGIFITAKKGKV